MLSNKQKAVIHVAKQKTGMTDDEYRALLSGYGVSSCAQLEQKQFKSIMRDFARLGFVTKYAATPPPSSKALLLGKIKALREQLGVGEAYVDAMANHMFKIASHRWLDAGQLHKVVAALNYHHKRREVAREKPVS
jgi:phage gp16-like protein